MAKRRTDQPRQQGDLAGEQDQHNRAGLVDQANCPNRRRDSRMQANQSMTSAISLRPKPATSALASGVRATSGSGTAYFSPVPVLRARDAGSRARPLRIGRHAARRRPWALTPRKQSGYAADTGTA